MKPQLRCLARTAVAILAMLLALTIGSHLVQGNASLSAAGSTGPDNFTVQVDDSMSFNDCGFTIESHVKGFIRVHDFLDEEGNLVREIANFNLKVTYTNPETGETLSSRSVGPDILTVNEDGSATVASIGIIARIVVPGEGLLVAQVGKIVFFFTDPEDEEPDVIFVAGPHEDLLAALCEALG